MREVPLKIPKTLVCMDVNIQAVSVDSVSAPKV
jgi:hypothetical protein